MIIRIKRDYTPSYKYNMLLKGNNYVVENLPLEVRNCVEGLLKSGWAVVVPETSVKTATITENYRVKQLEQKKVEAINSANEQATREEKTRNDAKEDEDKPVRKRRERKTISVTDEEEL